MANEVFSYRKDCPKLLEKVKKAYQGGVGKKDALEGILKKGFIGLYGSAVDRESDENTFDVFMGHEYTAAVLLSMTTAS